MRLIVMTLGALLTGSTANASFLTGNELHDYCESLPGTALGYIMGVADFNGINLAVVDLNGQSVQAKKFVCIPANATGDQTKDVVCKYLADHPKDRNLPAPILVYSALLDAWRCSQ